jgi:hypothetical protein
MFSNIHYYKWLLEAVFEKVVGDCKPHLSSSIDTLMRQLHEYYMIDTKSGEYSGFEALVLPKVVFNRPEETLHHIGYDCLFQLFNRRDLDNQIMMSWTL